MKLPGGKFNATQQPDKTWTIHAVPIFAKMEAGERHNDKRIDASWMQDAIARHKQLEVEQHHLAPVHENHHEPGKPTRLVGFLRPTHVGKLVQRGNLVDTLFADIVGVKQDDFDRMKSMEFPYRSAEINREWRPEIASLALLGDEAPFHKLPMLTIGREKPIEVMPEATQVFAEEPKCNLVLFSFKEATMPTPRKKKGKKGDAETVPENVNFADDDEEEGGDDKEKENLDDVASQITAAVQEFESRLPDMIKQFLDSMIPGGDDSEESEEGERLPAEAMSEETIADLTGRLAALERKNRLREAESEVRTLVDKTVEELNEGGWEVGKSTRQDMVNLAEHSSYPGKSLDIFAESYKKSTPQDPEQDLDEALAGGHIPEDTGDPDEVLAYREKGPEVYSNARKLSNQYDSLKEAGFPLSVTREEHIKINLNASA